MRLARQRPEDILPLAEYFLRKAQKKISGSAKRFSPEAAQALKAYSWPGNVRELEHTVERMLILASQAEIKLEDVPPEIRVLRKKSSLKQKDRGEN